MLSPHLSANDFQPNAKLFKIRSNILDIYDAHEILKNKVHMAGMMCCWPTKFQVYMAMLCCFEETKGGV
jgi:hypothetical protein